MNVSKDKKLTLDLVPSSMWTFNLRKILKKSQWDKLRKKVYKRAEYHCEICGGQGIFGRGHPVECHEKWEFDDENKIQKLIELMALCPLCHQVKHFGLTSLRGEKYQERALAHLMKINNMNRSQALRYVSKCFKINQERSRDEWQLDIDSLSDIIKSLDLP